MQDSRQHTNLQIRSTRLRSVFLFAAMITAPSVFSQMSTVTKDLSILEHIAPLSATSENEHTTVRYVEERLRKLAVSYTSHQITKPGPRGNIISALVPGHSKRTLAIVIPIDHPPENKSRQLGSAGITAVLHTLEVAKRNPLPVTLRVVFVSGEYRPEGRTIFGDKHSANNPSLQNPEAVIYLNLPTVPDLILLQLGGRKVQTPLWLLQSVATALDQNHLAFETRSTAIQIARIGLPIGHSLIDPYLTAGHPSIELSGRHLNVAVITESFRIDTWNAKFTSFVKSLGEQIAITNDANRWEQYYLYIRIGSFRLTLNEITVVMTVAVALSVSLALAILMPHQLRRYRRHLLRYLWIIPLAALVTFSALTLSTLLLSSVMVTRDMPMLWSLQPALSIAFKGAISLLIIIVSVKIFAKIRMRLPIGAIPFGLHEDHMRNRSLESGTLSAAAAAILPVVIVGTMIVDPVASLPFICAYFATLLFNLSRLRWIKTLWLAAAIAVPVTAAADLIAAGSDELLRALLLSPTIGNVILTFVLLPFILMVLRLTVKSGEPLAFWGESRRLTPLILILSLVSIASSILLYIAT